MYGEGRIADMIQIFKKELQSYRICDDWSFSFLKDIAFIKFTRCGLIAKICHRGNSSQKEMCYDSSIRNKTASKNNGGRHMLKTSELFINELKERDLKYRDIRTLQDGDDLVEVGFNLDSTRIQIMIFFDASEKSVALRCFEVTRVTEEQYPNALLSCNELNNKMRWVKFCIGQEMNVHAEADAVVDETTAAKVAMELMMRMASIVDEAYPMINKAIWS